MEYIQNIKKINEMNYTLYPQAKFPEARIVTYSNTNNNTYSNDILSNKYLKIDNNYTLDPIAKEISNNINRNYNNRIENANKLNEALEIIKNSIMDEAEDEAFYNMMINQAMQDEDKEIIKNIANDEKKHNMMLKQIYFSLTGNNVPTQNASMNIATNTYFNNLRKSLFGELSAIKKYRKVLAAMTDKDNYNKIMEIMTDEITHSNKFNYLISKYLINKEETKETKRE